jgi:Mycobacterium membrane protein
MSAPQGYPPPSATSPVPPAGMPAPVWDPNLGQWVYYTPAPQPKKSHRVRTIVLSVLGTLLVLVLASAAFGQGNATTPAPSAAQQAPQAAPTQVPAPVAPAPTTHAPTYSNGVPQLAPHTVTYEVTGTGPVSVTYSTTDYGQEQENYVSAPWTHTVTMQEYDITPSATAQRMNGGAGTVTVKIFRDDVQVAERTSSGPYAVVSAYGGQG